MAAYLTTFGLAIASVAMWTLRVAITARGNRAASSLIAMVEATTYLIAVSHITGALDAPTHLFVYAIGVGAGTYGGLTVDRRYVQCLDLGGAESAPSGRLQESNHIN
jgi:uncharacterized protein YebE (UPF0316 family)